MKKNVPRTTNGGSGSGTASYKGIVPETRDLSLCCIVKKSESVERDRKTWHWCPEHNKKGSYYGMYVTHKAPDFGEGKKRNDEHKASRKATTQRRGKTDKAGSASYEGDPYKGVDTYTKDDHIKLDAAIEAVLFTSNLTQEQQE